MFSNGYHAFNSAFNVALEDWSVNVGHEICLFFALIVFPFKINGNCIDLQFSQNNGTHEFLPAQGKPRLVLNVTSNKD